MKWIAYASVVVGAAAWMYLMYQEKSSKFVNEIMEWLMGFSKISWKK